MLCKMTLIYLFTLAQSMSNDKSDQQLLTYPCICLDGMKIHRTFCTVCGSFDKKLSEPRVNKMFKSKWFEGYYKENLSNRQESGVEGRA